MSPLTVEENTSAEEGTSSKWPVVVLAGVAAIIALATLAYLIYYVFTAHPKPSDINAGLASYLQKSPGLSSNASSPPRRKSKSRNSSRYGRRSRNSEES